MRGLLLKDILNLKRLAKQYLVILMAMFVWAAFMKNASFVTMYVVLCGSMVVLTSFSYDEYAHFEKYALTMPVTRDTLVKEKYLLLLMLVGGGTVLGIGLGAVLTVILREPVLELAVSGAAIGAVFLVVYSVVVPLIYKMGVEKARMCMVGIYIGLFALVFGTLKLVQLGKGIELPGRLDILLPVAGILVMVAVVIGSFRISLGIVRKKEW